MREEDKTFWKVALLFFSVLAIVVMLLILFGGE